MSEKRLTRYESDRILFGVAGGLAHYLNVDATIVRVLFALAALFTGGTAIVVYFVLMLVMPQEDFVGKVDSFDPDEVIIRDVD